MTRVSPDLRLRRMQRRYQDGDHRVSRDDAMAKVAAYQAEVDAVRNDPDLTEAGKRRRIGELYLRHKAQLDEYQAQEAARLDARRGDLDRRLFGAVARDPGSIIAARDAAERAEACTTLAEASKLLARAQRTGDHQLAAAVARHAAESGWPQLLDEYADDDLDKHAALTELRKLGGHFAESAVDRSNRIKDRFEREATYRVTRPTEITGYSDHALQAEITQHTAAGGPQDYTRPQPGEPGPIGTTVPSSGDVARAWNEAAAL